MTSPPLSQTLLAMTLALAGCGDHGQVQGLGQTKKTDPAPTANQDQSGDGKSTFNDGVTPPRAYYDALFAGALQKVDAGGTALTLNAAETLWVNFDGASLTKGFQPGQSFVLCSDTATIAASGLSPADRDTVVKEVQQYFDAAGVQLAVTATKPASGDFTTIVAGGAYKDLGCAGSGVAGIAPLDPGNANKNDIGFAFTDGANGALEIAQTVAHEAGHTYGLDHVTNSADLMFPTETPAITGFVDSRALLQQTLSGSGAAAAPAANPSGAAPAPAPAAGTQIPGLANLPSLLAGLPGLGQISAIGGLLPGLQAGSILDISKLLPGIQALLPTAALPANLQGLDKILTIVGLAGAAGQPAGGAAGTTPLGALDPKLLAGLLNANTSSKAVNAGSLAQLAGFTSLQGAVAQIQSLLGGPSAGNVAGALGGALGGAGASGGAASAIPNLAGLLGLGAQTNIASLLSGFLGSANVVNANFTGANAQALTSLLKVAYAQQFGQLLGSLP